MGYPVMRVYGRIALRNRARRAQERKRVQARTSRVLAWAIDALDEIEREIDRADFRRAQFKLVDDQLEYQRSWGGFP